MTELTVMDKAIGSDENCWLCLEPVDNVYHNGVQIFNCPHKICSECAETFDYKFEPTSRCGVCRVGEYVPLDKVEFHPVVKMLHSNFKTSQDRLNERIKLLEDQLRALQNPSPNTNGVVDNGRTRFNLKRSDQKTIYDKNPFFLGDNQGRTISGIVSMFVERRDGNVEVLEHLLNNNVDREMPRVLTTSQNREHREKFINGGEWSRGFDERLNQPYPGWENEKFKFVVKGDTKQFVCIKSSHTIKVARGMYEDAIQPQNPRTKTIMEKGVWYRKRILRTPQGLEFLQMDNTWRFLNIPAFYFNYNKTNQRLQAVSGEFPNINVEVNENDGGLVGS